MNFIESFRIAFQSMLTHKMRAVLTMLGIIIGVGAVVGMLAIGTGYQQLVQQEFDKIGVGVFFVNPSVDSRDSDETLQPRLTADDAEAIMRPGAAPAVEFVALELNRNGVVSAGGERYLFSIKGVTPNFFLIGDAKLGDGRYATEEEEQNGARVAVIGNEVATTLYGDIYSAVGRRINLNGVQFEVIGVSTTEQSGLGGAFGQNGPSQQIYIPFRTARDRLFRNEVSTRVDVSALNVKVHDVNQTDEAIRQVTAVLRAEHRLTYQVDDFSITNLQQAADQFNAITSGFSAFLGTIGGISLLVGGIGIMNIMLVSVAQRTKEIGLRKAVGARSYDIMMQFLIEALVLCLVGGALGILLGYLFSLLGSILLSSMADGDSITAVVSLNSIILATSISAAIGVFFGLFPAVRAARLDPIKALRNE